MNDPALENKKSGMLLFLAAEIMFFTGFLGAFFVLRKTAPNWQDVFKVLNVPMEILCAALLVLSSVIYALNFRSVRKNALWLPWFLGVLFLILRMGTVRSFQPSADLFSAFFCVVTWVHSFHLLAGLFCLAWFLKTSKPVSTFESFGLYWHFLTASWLVLFTLLAVL